MNVGAQEAFIYLIVAVAFGVVSAAIAEKRGYSRIGFFLLGFFLGCIGVVIALLLPSSSGGRVSTGDLARFARKFEMEGGAVCPKGYATKVHELAVKEGTPAALIDGPDGSRYWVPTSVLVPA